MPLTAAYSVPLVSPLYPSPPPWRYRDCSLAVIPFRTAPGVTRRLVPEPLVPNAEDLMLMMVGPMHNHALGSTTEAFIAVPSSFGELVGNYAVLVYLEDDACVTSGREIWGWPKKEARFRFSEDDLRVSATAERGGAELFRLGLELGDEAGPEDLALSPTWFNFKLIPAVAAGAPPAVMQLTATTFENVMVHEARRGTPALTFGNGSADPLADLLPVQELLGGVYLRRFQFDLLLGEVLHDYLAPDQAPSLVGTAAVGA
jgi:acetoacetate decarboxylase